MFSPNSPGCSDLVEEITMWPNKFNDGSLISTLVALAFRTEMGFSFSYECVAAETPPLTSAYVGARNAQDTGQVTKRICLAPPVPSNLGTQGHD